MLDMRRPPYLAQQLPVRDHHAEVLRQAGEKAKFQRREMDLHAVALDDVLFQIRRDLSQLEYRLAGAGAGGVAQRRAHARQQLADAEGLGDIVVRAGVERLGRECWRVRVRYGFMNRPDVVRALETCGALGLEIDFMDTSFFLSRQTIVPVPGRGGMAFWRERLFTAMARNAGSVTDFFNIPANRAVELGTRVEI